MMMMTLHSSPPKRSDVGLSMSPPVGMPPQIALLQGVIVVGEER